jgi:hypothetical protein
MKRVLVKVQMSLVVAVLIATLGAVQVNRMVNTHYHLDDSGRLVTHSHPYDKSDDTGPFKTHGHGKCDITTPVGSIDMTILSVLTFFFQPSAETKVYYSFTLPIWGEEGQHLFRGRAPPSFTV